MIRKTTKVILRIAVPALLILLLFPSPSGAPRNNDRTHAESTAYNLKNAIAAFYTEYRQYPGVTAPEGPDIDLGSGHRLMDILFGSDKEAGQGGVNPRGISFYVDKAARPLANGKSRKGVVLDSDGGGTLWDPWGNFYRVRVDASFDNRVDNPESPGSPLPESIIVWSAGKDGDFNTWKDNVRTW